MSLSSEDAAPFVAVEEDAVPLVDESGDVEKSLGALSDIEVVATVELGRTQLLVRDILKLHRGAVIELEKLVGQPADLLVNNMPFAKGEVIVINGRFGFRITKFVSPTGS
ncbi:MAG: Flagellar motor switch protein FliN [bacterium ADurb.Bin429]|nr:MAG: Flagellar motor switch protein FliN [bacterium ADurb.Bin429]